ncbi:MAG: hypothetical protein R3C46_01940 [Hyphomonadaceae bacterium]
MRRPTPSHPRFSYRPETGEIRSILPRDPAWRPRAWRLGRPEPTERVYDDEEAEALQTVAMVLAELVAAAADLRV